MVMQALADTIKKPLAVFRQNDALDAGKPTDKLPDERKTVEMVDRLLEEANSFRVRGGNGLSLESEWERGGQRFMGNHWHTPQTTQALQEGFRAFYVLGNQSDGAQQGVHRVTLNRTQVAIVSNVAQQTSQPFVVRFEPTETGDDPTYFLSKRGAMQIQGVLTDPLIQQTARELESRGQVVDPEAIAQAEAQHLASLPVQFSPGQLGGEFGPSEPLDRDQAGWIRQLIDAGQMDKDALIEINDRTVAEAAQQLFDTLWRKADGDTYVLMCEFMSNVYGHQPIRFQWHVEGPHKHSFRLALDHILNVWIDPTQFHIADSAYVIFDHVMDLDAARERWQDRPEVVSALEQAAEEGSQDGGGDSLRIGGIYATTEFQRKMVKVRTCWRRHHRVPMTVEEAIESGKVIREPVLLPMTPEQQAMEAEALAAGGVVPQQEQATDPETGDPLWRYLQPETGEDVEPQESCGHGTAWPDTWGVAQIVTLPDRKQLVEYIRCPYADIPYGWNINIPRPDGSPYGIGEPTRLEDVSQEINRIMSIIDNVCRKYQMPEIWMPMSVYESLKKTGVPLHSRAGAIRPLDDMKYRELMNSGGPNAMYVNAPTVPPMLVGYLEFLIQQHDQMSGNVDVRQGRTPSGVKSGKAISALQEQAAGPLAFKSRFTEATLRRLADLGLDAIRKWLPEKVGLKILSRYHLAAFRELTRRMGAMEFDTMVEIVTGRGASRQIDEQRAIEMYGAQLLARRSAMQRLGVDDPDAENARIVEEQTGMAMASPPAQAAAVDQQDPRVQQQQQAENN